MMRLRSGAAAWLVAAMLLAAGCTIPGFSKSSDPAPGSEPKQPPAQDSSVQAPGRLPKIGPYAVDTFAQGLAVPWSMAEAPDGRLFVTERGGSLRVFDKDGKLQQEPVAVMSAPFQARGEGGLLGVALHPDFGSNGYLYVYYTYAGDNGAVLNKVVRYQTSVSSSRTVARPVDTIIEGIPGSTNHNGGRIAFGPDRLLYMTAGDMYQPTLAQNQSSLGGKILRVKDDGSVPDGNPFPGSPVYSMGHRNPQGLAWHPESGKLYASEHGQSAHDEINWIEKGANYGWPVIEGDKQRDGMHTPLLHSGTVTWAPSGLTFLTKGEWKHQLLVANLRGTQLLRLQLDRAGTKITVLDPLFKGELGRIRDVKELSSGVVLIMTNNRDGRGNPGPDDDRIIRLTPIR